MEPLLYVALGVLLGSWLYIPIIRQILKDHHESAEREHKSKMQLIDALVQANES